MSHLKERDYTYFTTVRGMCRTCRSIVPARVFFRNGEVWQQSLCPACENSPAKISSDKDWYFKTVLKTVPDGSPLKGSIPLKQGCPNDCGPCVWHASPCQLPIISITNVCNMNCPICFTYNRKDSEYYTPVEEMKKIIDSIIESSGVIDVINITGGEPALHPRLFDILECCKRKEIGRITMNSNGIRLAEDISFCRRLSELGVHVILSLHTLDPDISAKIHGCDLSLTKLKAIERLSKAEVRMTLLNVMIRGLNENVSGEILDMMKANDNILSLTIQTMTYTGQGGGRFSNREHIPVDEATNIVCENSAGEFEFSDFSPRPQAHPLCYSTCYFFKNENKFLPLARFIPVGKIQEFMKDSYLMRLDEDAGFFTDIINNLHAKGEIGSLKFFRKLIQNLYPAGKALSVLERQRTAESFIRTIYIHSHMDEDNFDCSRAMMCTDLVPSEPGRFIPACTYNLFYRMQDERFYVGAE